MNTKIYNINYNTVVEWLLPIPLRKTRLLAWMKLMATPFIIVYNNILRFRTARLYELKITPSKCYLEQMLRDRYDFSQRRIFISDGIDKPPFYIFQNDELKPKYLRKIIEGNPVRIYTSGESGTIGDDFIVFVPKDINFELAEMTSLIKAFKLSGTKFKIQSF